MKPIPLCRFICNLSDERELSAVLHTSHTNWFFGSALHSSSMPMTTPSPAPFRWATLWCCPTAFLEVKLRSHPTQSQVWSFRVSFAAFASLRSDFSFFTIHSSTSLSNSWSVILPITFRRLLVELILQSKTVVCKSVSKLVGSAGDGDRYSDQKPLKLQNFQNIFDWRYRQ